MRFVSLIWVLSVACGNETGSVRSSELASANVEALGKIPEGVKLSREEIVTGMERAKTRVHGCQAEHQSSGPAEVRVAVTSGRVSEVRALRIFGGTPVGTCIESVVKQVTFPPGKHRRFDYIFTSQ